MNHDTMRATGPLVHAGEHRVRPTEREAQDNLRAMLQLCAAGRLRCSEKTKRPSATTMDTVADHLSNGDFYRDEDLAAFAWPLLIQAGGLGRLDSGRLRLTTKGLAAQRKPSAKVIRDLWQRWNSHAVIDEFSRIEAIKGQRARNVLSAAKTRRQVVATALAGCPPHDWISVDALFATMRRRKLNPRITRNDMALWKLYLVDPQHGSLGYAGFGDWNSLEGRYTLAVLFEYAGTLGLFDLENLHPNGEREDYRDNWGADDLNALSRYDGLQAIRMTALGRYVFGIEDEYRPSTRRNAPPAVSVLPDLTIAATEPLDASDEVLVSAYAERAADQVWTLSPGTACCPRSTSDAT
ncbi:hypothetical protein EV643_13810 [Kribbella sp. VKM Ac-2527]|uniref:Uncharacterized protein n=1 Tax=Kribbella caucasensis TaxID=2512215 RepID=A0A4R6J5Q9_9ACTN|nr:hypothetical protein [Kribbella sp. VKM Ac-2527]TDO30397.1 hypothetical protein EV643_13810 [Kribbella sp. VKM Ac-2527]